jgi:hypothetical protein
MPKKDPNYVMICRKDLLFLPSFLNTIGAIFILVKFIFAKTGKLSPTGSSRYFLF